MPEIIFEKQTRPLHLRHGVLHHQGLRAPSDALARPDIGQAAQPAGQSSASGIESAPGRRTRDDGMLHVDDGTQLPLSLEDWDIVCLDGHELTIAWVERNGAPHLVGIRNHTSDELQIGGLPYTLKWAGASLGLALLGLVVWLLYAPQTVWYVSTPVVIGALLGSFLCWRTSRRQFAAVHLTHQQVRAALVD